MNHLQDGLIPNMFPDQQNGGIYNTVDATLWFFHALDRYIEITSDKKLLEEFLPKLKEIFRAHLQGTRFGIRVDPEDGLLIQGDPTHALTWMDAVYERLIITPRRGKAVEINALWYNALMIGIEWLKEQEEPVEELQHLAKLCKDSFNKKFWCAEKGYLYDVVEGEKGNDLACRPNQLFAISLKYPILRKQYWEKVIETVTDKLLTSYGLRTLSAGHPDYKVAYQGNLFLRDSAYHQGTVWPFLIGHFIDAYLKVHPDHKKEAGRFLSQFNTALGEAGVGTISEIYDAEKPFNHRGCIAQAWSVAEVLRALLKTTV
jgi:predicted glycogen debranching enzyme